MNEVPVHRHFKQPHAPYVACGSYPARKTTEDYRLVNCGNCRRTKAFRNRIAELAK